MHKNKLERNILNKQILKYQTAVFISKLSDERSKKPKDMGEVRVDLILERTIFNRNRKNEYLQETLPYFPFDILILYNATINNTPSFQYILINEICLFINEYLKVLNLLIKQNLKEVENENERMAVFIDYFISLYFLFKMFSNIELDKYEKNIDYKIMEIFKALRKILKYFNIYIPRFNKSSIDNLVNIKFENKTKNTLYLETIDFIIDISLLRNNDMFIKKEIFKKKDDKKNIFVEFIIKHIYAINDMKEFPMHNYLLNNLCSILKLNIFSNIKIEYIKQILNSCNYEHTFSETNALFGNLMAFQSNELFLNWNTYKKLYNILLFKSIKKRTKKVYQKRIQELDISKKIRIPLFSETSITTNNLIECKSYEFSQKQINLLIFEEQFANKYFYKSFMQITKLKLQLIEFIKISNKNESLFYKTLICKKLSPNACSFILIAESIKHRSSFLLRSIEKIIMLEELNLSGDKIFLIKLFSNLTEKTLNTIITSYPTQVESKQIEIQMKCEKYKLIGLYLRVSYLFLDRNKLSKLIMKKSNKKILKHYLHTFEIKEIPEKYKTASLEKSLFEGIFVPLVEKKISDDMIIQEMAKEFGNNILYTFRRIMSSFTCPLDGNEVNYILEIIGEVFAEKIIISSYILKRENDKCNLCILENIKKEEESIFTLIKKSCYVIVYSFLTLNMDMHLQITKTKKNKKSLNSYINMILEVESISKLNKIIKDINNSLLVRILKEIFNKTTYQHIYESIKLEEIKYKEFEISFYEIMNLENEFKNIVNKHKSCEFCLQNIIKTYLLKPSEDIVDFRISTMEGSNTNEICNPCFKNILKNLVHKFYELKPNKIEFFIKNFMETSTLEDLLFCINNFLKESQFSKKQIKTIFLLLENTSEISHNLETFLINCLSNYKECLPENKFIEDNFIKVLEILGKEITNKGILNSVYLIFYIHTSPEQHLSQSKEKELTNFYIKIFEIKNTETDFENTLLNFYLNGIEIFKDLENQNILRLLNNVNINFIDNKSFQKGIKKVYESSFTYFSYSICVLDLNTQENTEYFFNSLNNFDALIDNNFLTENEKALLLLFLIEKASTFVYKNINAYQIFIKNSFEYIFNKEFNKNIILEMHFLKWIFYAVLNYEINSFETIKDQNFIKLLKQLLYYMSLIIRSSNILNIFLRFLFSIPSEIEFNNSITKLHSLRICIRNVLKNNLNINFVNSIYLNPLENINFRFPNIIYMSINETIKEIKTMRWVSDPLSFIKSLNNKLIETNNPLNIDLTDFNEFINIGFLHEDNVSENIIEL